MVWKSKLKPMLRSLLAGQIAVVVLFGLDAADSAHLFGRSTRRIRTDYETFMLLKEAVVDFSSRMLLAYVLMGLLFAGVLHWGVQFLHPKGREGAAWWKTALGLSVLFFGLGTLRHIYWYPAMYDSFHYVATIVDALEAQYIDALIVPCALGFLGLGVWRWRQTGSGWGRQMLRVALPLVAWMGASGWLLSNPEPTPTRDNQGMNIVILGVDSLRPDHLGFYGYERDTAPNIDALLRESITFDSAWTPIARTYAAWTSMLTGLIPINNGIRDNLPVPEKLIPEVPSLPAFLQKKGWKTAFITDDSRFSYMLPEMGWDTIVQPPPNLKNFAVSMHEPRFRAFAWLMHNPIGFSFVPTAAYNQAFSRSFRPDLFVDKALDTMGEISSDGEPFLMAMHTCVLHVPSVRPYPWHQMFDQRGYRGDNRFRYSSFGTALLDGDGDKDRSPEAKLKIAEQDLRVYDSGIDMADQMVAKVVAELKRSGLWDNTIVVLLSDHGEEHYEPGHPYKFHGPNHGYHSYGDGQHHVVWSIRIPDGSRAGTSIKEPVRLFDLVPTLMDLLEMEWPAEIDGINAFDAPQETTQREVYIETGVSEPRYWTEGHKRYPFKRLNAKYEIDESTGRINIKDSFMPHLVAAKDRVMQVGRWKLIWHAVEEGMKIDLFDRENDPSNLKPVTHEHPEIAADLLNRMSVYLERDGIVLSELRKDSESSPE